MKLGRFQYWSLPLTSGNMPMRKQIMLKLAFINGTQCTQFKGLYDLRHKNTQAMIL